MARICGTIRPGGRCQADHHSRNQTMGRSLLLFFLGVPIPIIILLALFWH
jgi:hypothetical protein